MFSKPGAAKVKGAGVDCCQLLVAVYADETHLVAAPDIATYPADWFLHSDEQKVLAHVTASCVKVATPEPGDIGVFKFGRAIAHAGILLEWRPEPDGPLLLHAWQPLGQVTIDSVAKAHTLGARLAGWYSLRRWHPEVPR